MNFFRLITIVFLLLGVIFFSGSVYAAEGGIVPCGNPGQPDCTKCDLFKLGTGIMDFALYKFMPVIATFAFVWAGFLITMAGANPSWYKQGIDIFKNTAYGIATILIAWMVVNTFLVNFVKQEGPFAAPWDEIACTETGGTVGPNPTSTMIPNPNPIPAGPANQLAQGLMSSGVGLSTKGDCGPANTAQTTMTAIANNQFPPVCSPSCSCKAGGTTGKVTVNTKVLQALVDLRNAGFQFTITSLTTGEHSAGSLHYAGRAADIQIQGTSSEHWKSAVQFLQSKGANAFCEAGNGAKVDSCAMPPTDHIHFSR